MVIFSWVCLLSDIECTGRQPPTWPQGMTTGTLGLSRPMRVLEQHTFLPAVVSFSSLVNSAQRPGRSPWGGQGGSHLKRRAVGDTASNTRASALSIPVGSSSHTEQNLLGSLRPCPATVRAAWAPSPQERRLEGTSACVGSSTGSSEALPAKEPCALDAGWLRTREPEARASQGLKLAFPFR